MATSVQQALKMGPSDESLVLKGWVKQLRKTKKLMFLHLNDGLSHESIQVVYNIPEGYTENITYESSVEVTGKIVSSPGAEQSVEIAATSVKLIGECNVDTYPFPKGKVAHSMEFLRTNPQLRPKTQIISSITRIKHRMVKASHDFYDKEGFTWIQTPIITRSDCEGGGEAFAVTAPNEPKFFKDQAFLTVSGQLHVEPYACALGKVYTFGPSFRAEKSKTTRHLSEFWMLEPEMAFTTLDQLLVLIESYFKYVTKEVLSTMTSELKVCAIKYDKSLLQKLSDMIDEPFANITYTKAVELLQDSGKTFDKPSEWGVDFGSDQEKYLCEVVFKKPTFITHYPSHIKSFYMFEDADVDYDASRKTVACVDCLFPGIGEVVGGSQREHRLDVLEKKLEDAGLDKSLYDWYLDTRRYGTVPHSGFGVGMDRFLRFLTGVDHIMDLIPYPVRYDHLSN